MAEESFQEKTELATPKRREEARRKGQVARSQELNSAIVLLAALVGLYFLGDLLFQNLANFTIHTIEQSYTIELTPNSTHINIANWGKIFFTTVGPILIVLGIAAFVVSLAQVGLVLNEDAFKIKLQRLDPIGGAKRLLSKRSLVELAKGIFKIFIVGYIGYITIVPEMHRIAVLADSDLSTTLKFVSTMVFKIGVRTTLVLLVLSILDYLYQRWEFNKSIRMTKQEVKEETKQTEGDPQIRMRIRSLQREASRQRMMEEVPRADVVITNPIHYAVALQYDTETMPAPKVVAKGQNLIAQKIKQVARDSNITIVENKPLAQTLFKTVEIGQDIPEDLYRAVAEVLAYVFRLKNSQKKG